MALVGCGIFFKWNQKRQYCPTQIKLGVTNAHAVSRIELSRMLGDTSAVKSRSRRRWGHSSYIGKFEMFSRYLPTGKFFDSLGSSRKCGFEKKLLFSKRIFESFPRTPITSNFVNFPMCGFFWKPPPPSLPSRGLTLSTHVSRVTNFEFWWPWWLWRFSHTKQKRQYRQIKINWSPQAHPYAETVFLTDANANAYA